MFVGRTLKVGTDTTLVLRSTNGQGELNAGDTRRVLEVNGVYGPASLQVVGVAVRDGTYTPQSDYDAGGCINARGDGATLTLDGAVVSGCLAEGNSEGVRALAWNLG